MSDIDEQRVAKDKAAIEAMKNAKANMGVAINRIETLESALRMARLRLKDTKEHIGRNSYAYTSSGPQKTVHDVIDEQLAAIDSVI